MNEAEQIEHEASRWLAARDARVTTPEQGQEFERWLEADIRRRVAYLRLEASWKRAERLRNLRPLDRDPDPDLFRERPLRRSWSAALAATLLAAVVVSGAWFYRASSAWQVYETRVGGFARAVLTDGSVVDLNTNSELRVRIGGERREVRLVRGEGRFTVAHDAARPFTVSAGPAAVRAVGTAFTVRLHDSSRVDVLVSDGEVAIASGSLAGVSPLRAGEAAMVLPGHLSVSQVEPRQLARRLAWTSGGLQFSGELLGDAVAEFNRYNRKQLRLADPALASLRVGGNFTATDPDSFAAALASAFSLRVTAENSETIVLRPP